MPDLQVRGLTLGNENPDRIDFWGEIENASDTTRRWVRVTIQLLDDNDDLLAENTDLVGLEWITPGARVPFYLAFEDPPARWRRYRIEVTGRPHEFEDPTIPQPHLQLDVERCHYREIGRGGLICSVLGMIRNGGPEPASHVKVAGTLYGPSGNVVGVLSPYLVPRGIFEVGQEMVFELKYYSLAGMVVNYMIQVQGRKLPD
jgi:hypothetical protein